MIETLLAAHASGVGYLLRLSTSETAKLAPAVPALCKCLGESEWNVRKQAAGALRNLRAEHLAPAVPALAKCLEDKSEDVRKRVAAALAKCLKDQSEDVRKQVAA